MKAMLLVPETQIQSGVEMCMAVGARSVHRKEVVGLASETKNHLCFEEEV
jgi:hypothetical protein